MFAADAAGRLVEAEDRRGDEAGARRAAEQYLAAHPSGSHAGYAKHVLARGSKAVPPEARLAGRVTPGGSPGEPGLPPSLRRREPPLPRHSSSSPGPRSPPGPRSRRARAPTETRTEAPSTIAVLCAPAIASACGSWPRSSRSASGRSASTPRPSRRRARPSGLGARGGRHRRDRRPSERGVEIWIADRVTGKTVLREMADDGGTPDRDAALALRAVELLRASLLEVGLPAPPPGEVPATPEIREKLRVRAPDTPPAPAQRPSPALHLSLAPVCC